MFSKIEETVEEKDTVAGENVITYDGDSDDPLGDELDIPTFLRKSRGVKNPKKKRNVEIALFMFYDR